MRLPITPNHMPATQEITESLIRENIVRAMSEVFKTMLSKSIKLSDQAEPGSSQGWPPVAPATPAEATPQIVGTVGFLGDANGLIYLYFDEVFATDCTEQILGMTRKELEEDDGFVNDAVGELTNMIVGTFKNGLCDQGYPCKLTIPSILRGRNFCVEPMSSAKRYIYIFESGGRRVVADILMNNEE
jgi:chemotaxis protein CheX